MVSPLFLAILLNSFSVDEVAARMVFEATEFESIVKIELGQFLDALGPIFEQNLDLTRERLVERARRRHHRVSYRIL